MSNKPRWAVLSWGRFVSEMLEHGPITLEIRGRPEVASRRWLQVTFTDSMGRQHQRSGQDMDIVLRRCAEVEDKAEQDWEEGHGEHI